MTHLSVGSDCLTGKAQYATKGDARRAANATTRVKGWRTRQYRCPWCGCWHIGNPREDNSKSRQRR